MKRKNAWELRGRILFKQSVLDQKRSWWRRDRLILLSFFPVPHIGPQDGWNFNRAVRLLEIFQDGHYGSPDGQAGPIERVDKVGLGLFLSPTRPIIDARPPRLAKRVFYSCRSTESLCLC